MDEFDAPLGKKTTSTRVKLPFTPPQLMAGLLATSVVAVGLWTMFASDPYGGEPVAVVPTSSSDPATQKDRSVAAAIKAGSPPLPRPAGTGATVPAATSAEPAPPGSKTVTIIDGSSGKRQEVLLPPHGSGAAGASGGGAGSAGAAGASSAAPRTTVDARFLETTRHGQIPKIAADGTRPSTAFAKAVTIDPSRKNFPKVAIIVGSLGVSASGTAEALERLPAPVTLAFSPYGTDVERLVAQAASRQHEVLLQVPMEPFDFPDNDPGPQTLLTSLGADQNIDRLHWQMSRMKGYVGIVGFMGARFLASDQALSPVMREAAKRGLIFVDNGASQRSVASQISGSQNLPFARADVVIDAVPTTAEIEAALNRLESAARQQGSAVGIASALPAAVNHIAAWVKKAESRGILLVPISMVANKAKES
ncbi:MAG: divergent polysaccharide deacetylase family protein [Pseudolabrys sp.]